MMKDTKKGIAEQSEMGLSLEELIRRGARELIQKAIEVEVQELLAEYGNVEMLGGQRAVVRNGYLPAREVLTAVGNVEVRVPKVRDRSGGGIKFNSALVPPFVRRSQRVSAALPWLYLKGISTGDMREALTVLLGDQAKGLSANVVSRLKSEWATEYAGWMKRDLSASRYVYWWVDGIHTGLRQEDDARQCLMVIIGVTPEGNKELVTRRQRCWVHKTANVLNALPKSLQAKAKADLPEIWMAPTRPQAITAFDHFLKTYGAKYPKATDKLAKDREALIAFYDFPAEHWIHLRTTNPIESTFATVRHRTTRTKNCVTRSTFLGLAFKLVQEAQKSWRRIRAVERIAELLAGTVFRDGVPAPIDDPRQQRLAA